MSQGTMRSAAMGSSHQALKSAKAATPTKAVIVRYEQATVSFASAASAGSRPFAATQSFPSEMMGISTRQRKEQQSEPRFLHTVLRCKGV
jgi:hypothetical protein